MSQNDSLFSLFVLFMKTGIQTFGGGYGILPILQKELVDDRNWISSEELLDYYALGQCTPGIIAVNVATLIGYKRKGLAGSIAATAGFVLPSFIVIIIIAAVLEEIASLEIVSHVFAGIRLAVCALIFHTVFTLKKAAIADFSGICVFIFFFIASAVFSISPVISVIAAVISGLLLRKVSRNEEKTKKIIEKYNKEKEKKDEMIEEKEKKDETIEEKDEKDEKDEVMEENELKCENEIKSENEEKEKHRSGDKS